MSGSPIDRWYVVRTHARAEAKAVFNLQRQAFKTYLPQYLKRRRHARRTDWVPAPLFPGYLFVAMDPEITQWRPVRSTIGVAELICDGNRPTPVPVGIVEDIRARQNEQGFVVVKTASEFVPGEKVTVAAGAMADHVGLFEKMTDEQRVVLLLDLLGRKVRVELALEDLAVNA